MSACDFRDDVVARLTQDLVGPLSEDEILTDRPTRRYSTGILYPRDSQMDDAEDEDGGMAVNEAEDAASSTDTSGVPLYTAMKPSTAGLSFAVDPASERALPEMNVEVRWALYARFAVGDSGEEVEGEPPDRAHERWRRIPIRVQLTLDLHPGPRRLDLAEFDPRAKDLELFVLVTPHARLLTVTFAIANRRFRGESAAQAEQQHIFQVGLSVLGVSNGRFAPRPSRRVETDEDSRTAALIFRDVEEHVVGHTCSAQALLAPDGSVLRLNTEWIPAIEVQGVSDDGDPVFERLRNHESLRPLEAAWLANASLSDLVEGIEMVVQAYLEWIARENARITNLRPELRPQAFRHIERCEQGARRMQEALVFLKENTEARTAFQLSQEAMRLQFGWQRNGEKLVWRPFQLAFQLLVLASLGIRTHADRDTMDLLWFPTGGGKTEAYLALTAFIIFLRRLRPSGGQMGKGVAALMRYTLRLLTVQQFQRAAAVICACELLRRRSKKGVRGLSDLGDTPIGVGLWVGASATPLTLEEAVARRPGDTSRAEQLTACPACREALRWKITAKETTVDCPSPATKCEYAATGSKIPIWTIDEEVYRHAPSLLIGTVDKFAQIVRKPETRVLFGLGTGAAPPDLIIQDELHLISGPLGSIAGLYEVAIDELCRRDQVRPKVIGSTATIRRATEQAQALFDRKTYQFPSPGVDSENSCFAVTDKRNPGRKYLGVSTAGRSATYMLQALSACLLQSASYPQAKDDRDSYWTLVIYFNSLRELGRALVLMQDDVPVTIGQIAARRSERSRKTGAPAELTSRRSAYEIREMLDQLNRTTGDPQAVDLVLASNMISVGMDIPRLGMMIMNAQPKTLSEYIQATSRVGRGNVPGLIVTMYNSTRARDRSHYESFETWHRCLYRDVEATSVTPFASRAQDKALHAVLVALVRHLVPGMDRQPVLDDLRRERADEIAAAIEARVARVDPSERVAVSQKLKRLLDEWSSRPDLQRYWDDFGRSISLLMSAEQFAAKADVDSDLDPSGSRRALWPTPNSMREVEAGAPFILRNVITGGDS